MEITRVQNCNFEKGSEKTKESSGSDFMEVFSKTLSASKEKQKRTENTGPRMEKNSDRSGAEEAVRAKDTTEPDASIDHAEEITETAGIKETFTDDKSEETQASDQTEESRQEAEGEKQESAPAIVSEEMAALVWTEIPGEQPAADDCIEQKTADAVREILPQEKENSDVLKMSNRQEVLPEENGRSQVLKQNSQEAFKIQKQGESGKTGDPAASRTIPADEMKQMPGQAAVKTENPETGQGEHREQKDAGAWKEQAELLKQMGAKPTGSKEAGMEEQKQVNFEELQKQVDNSTYWDPGQAALKNLGASEKMQTFTIRENELPASVETQIKSGLSLGMQKGLQLFTIKLKPEGLGEVIVHMASAGGKLAVSIGVTNAETQKMLQSEMMQLREMLKPVNAEVKEVYHSQQQESEMMNYQQAFYQQQRQQYYARMQKVHRQLQAEMPEEIPEMPEAALKSARYESGGLNAYV